MDTLREWPTGAPSFKDRIVTLIGVRPDGTWVFSNTVGGKRALLAGTTGQLAAAWTGRYTSDVFAVDRVLVAAALGPGSVG